MSNKSEDEKPQRSQNVKEQIVEYALAGKLDHSTFLNTSHTVTCNRCKQRFTVRYIDCLKNGEFKIGKSQGIEAEYLLGAFMAIEEEKVTAIILELNCEHCDGKVEIVPFTVEYLMMISMRPDPSKMMYA